MTRQLSRTEAWERAHEVFQQVNFNSFDFNTIKESLLDYMKLYFPEDFNDYIESSEFIAILELFAYIGEQLAYRVDMNAHENFISTAQRKESILRLATLVSYKASRNIPARGLVKLTSIQTTENVVDSNGQNLSGRQITWNDPNNPNWKEQFILVLNRVLEQEFGTVSPGERIQVDDVLFELYTLNNNSLRNGGRTILPYNVSVAGQTVPMEVVPTALTENGPEERRPENDTNLSITYASDGLGDSSSTTGFLMFTKQGTLARQRQQFDGVTPNQTFTISKNNINDTDVWVNNINSDTGEILDQNPAEGVFPHLVSDSMRYGEWVQVDIGNAQNILYNTNEKRQKYEVETLANDQVRIIFGDGEFADIPSGTMEFWYRTSLNEDTTIPRSAVVDQSTSITYNDVTNTTQTLSLTFSLVNSLQNGSPSEDIEHIRRVAPSVYYSQDRMVNGRDYNTFPLQDPSILKLRTINRTFAGDSKYIGWYDPSERYDNVKLFGDDLAVYWEESAPDNGESIRVNTPTTSNQLLQNTIQPLLSSTDFFSIIGPIKEQYGGDAAQIRKTFSTQDYSFTNSNENEIANLTDQLNTAANGGGDVDIYYAFSDGNYEEWVGSGDLSGGPAPNHQHPCTGVICAPPDELIWMMRVSAVFDGPDHSGWVVQWRTRRLIGHSEDTKFWNTNTTDNILNFDTLNSVQDQLVVLKANVNANKTSILNKNHNFSIIAQETIDIDPSLPNNGLPDIHRLSILPEDTNQDGIADNLSQTNLFDRVLEGTWPIVDVDGGTSAGTTTIDLSLINEKYNNSTEKGLDNDVEVYVDGTPRLFSTSDLIIGGSNPARNIQQQIDTGDLTGKNVRIVIKDYVYFARETVLNSWVPKHDTDTIRSKFITEDVQTISDALYKRQPGRYPLNFGWFHFTPQQHLIDPAPSNIHDMFIVTRGYYRELQRYIQNRTEVEPSEPTALDLRITYSNLLENKMLSDTVVLHPGKFKILFGPRSRPELRARFKVIRPRLSNMTDNQVKVQIVDAIQEFHDVEDWEFGETFYFMQLAAFIHSRIGPEIDSIVLVPTSTQNQFGDLFEVQARENELFIPDVSTSDIDVVQSYTPENLRLNN